VLADPGTAAAQPLAGIANGMVSRSRGLAGRRLGLTPA
jgi:hypothetical protein